MAYEKRILITGYFVGDNRILHGKEDYFERLIDYMSKHHGLFFDIKDVGIKFVGLREVNIGNFKFTIFKKKPLIKLSLPSRCTYSYITEHTGSYFGFPNIKSIIFGNDRNICLDVAKRQSSYGTQRKRPKFLAILRKVVFFLSAGIALKHVTSELIRLNPSLIICFNREAPINNLIRIVAKKLFIPILFMEGGILPGTIEIDSVGTEALSWPVRHLDKFNQLELSEEDKTRATEFLSFLREKK